MARVRRILRQDQPTVYHVISRTALDGLPFADEDKEYLLGLIRHWSRIFFVDVLGFAIMGNHFHLVVRVHPGDGISDDEVARRYAIMRGGEGACPVGEELERLRSKLCSLSWYVKEIKQGFSRYFNKKYGRKGFLWGDRFKSLMVEEGDTLLNLLAYVDLNPVRAGIVETPEEYRWCSLGYYAQSGNRDKLLCPEFGMEEWGELDEDEAFRRYREYVYEVSGLGERRGIKESIIDEERRRGYRIPLREVLLRRCRYFSDGCVLGGRAFVSTAFHRFMGLLGLRRHRRAHRIFSGVEIYSLRRLRTV